MIPKNLGTISLLSRFYPFIETRKRIKFLASWLSGSALLQRYAEFNRLL